MSIESPTPTTSVPETEVRPRPSAPPESIRQLVMLCRPDGTDPEVLRDDFGISDRASSLSALLELDAIPECLPATAWCRVSNCPCELHLSSAGNRMLVVAREAQTEPHGKFKRIIESMHEGYIQTDLLGRMTLVNPAAVRLLGYDSVSELLGLDHKTLYADPVLYQVMEWALVENGLLLNYMNQIRRKDGSVRIFEGDLRLERGGKGQPKFVEILFRDVSDRVENEMEQRRARRAADAANRAKGDFLATMSHEIRTPLNGVLGLTNLLARTDLSKRQRDYIANIQVSAQVLLRVVNDILDYSKVEAGRLVLEKSEFCLDEVLDSLVALIISRIDAKGLELVISIADDVPQQLVGDSGRLGQVLLNLVGNAVKFAETGHIKVSVSVLSPPAEGMVDVRFEVEDRGPGIPEDQIDGLFESYVQANTSITRKFGGTGLGLAISKRLVHLMNGQIEATSQPGEGSRFSFSARFGTGSLPERTFPLKAVVVDFHAQARQTLAATLKRLGCAVSEEEAETQAVDLVFMDGELCAQLAPDGLLLGQPSAKLAAVIHSRDVELYAPRVGSTLDGLLVRPFTRSSVAKAIHCMMEDTNAGPAAAHTQERVNLSGARILVVEDNTINQQIAREILEDWGVEVDLAGDGTEALVKRINTEPCPWQLVLMDIQMPNMDGFTATTQLRRHERLKDLPIIAMTAHVLAKERARCLEVGMNAYVTKPIDPNVLLSTLQRWLPELKARVEEPASDLSIAGVDTLNGIRRMGGRREPYLKLLLKLCSEREQMMARIDDAIISANGEQLKFATHSLRGAAGNLGLTEVARIAGRMESQPLDQARLGRDELATAFEQVCSEILRFETKDAARTSSIVQPVHLAELEQLSSLLHTSDGAAVELMEHLLERLGPSDRYKKLEELVRNFEFQLALEELAGLRRILEG